MVIINKAGAKSSRPEKLRIKKLSIVVYNYAALSIFCQEQKENRINP